SISAPARGSPRCSTSSKILSARLTLPGPALASSSLAATALRMRAIAPPLSGLFSGILHYRPVFGIGILPPPALVPGRRPAMLITGIDVMELRVPGWTGETFDGSYDNCVIQIHTDAGVSGIGEVDSVPSVIRAIVEAPRSHTHAMGLKSVLLGRDPSDVEALWDEMYDATSYFGRRGAVVHAI